MSKIQESLKANEAEILAALPSEFHAGFKKEMEAPPADAAPLSGEAQIAAIKAELVANPDVNETEAAGELKDIKAPDPIVLPTAEESASEQAALLAEVKASIK